MTGNLVHFDAVASPAYSAALMICEKMSECSGMRMMNLGELVGYSALVPTKSCATQPNTKNKDHWVLSAQWFDTRRTACKLRHDFDFDLFTAAILLGNFQRIEELAQTARSMQLTMHRMMRSGADASAEFERDDGTQRDLFLKNKR